MRARTPQGIRFETIDYRNSEDVNNAADVYDSAFSEHPWHNDPDEGFGSNELRSAQAIDSTGQGRCFVARETASDKIVGVAHGYMLDSGENVRDKLQTLALERLRNEKGYSGGKVFYLNFFAVHPQTQGKGVGQILDDMRLAHARELGCSSVLVWTHPEAVARKKILERNKFKKLLATEDREYYWKPLV